MPGALKLHWINFRMCIGLHVGVMPSLQIPTASHTYSSSEEIQLSWADGIAAVVNILLQNINENGKSSKKKSKRTAVLASISLTDLESVLSIMRVKALVRL